MDDGVRVLPLLGLPEVQAGDDLAALLLAAASRAPVRGLRDGDVLVVTHKVVAKAEGCAIDLRTVEPSAFAHAIAQRWDKDPRQVEVVLSGLSVFCLGGYLTRERVDEHVDGLGKRGTTLNVVISNQLKYAMLSEHRRVVVKGTIPKTKGKA